MQRGGKLENNSRYVWRQTNPKTDFSLKQTLLLDRMLSTRYSGNNGDLVGKDAKEADSIRPRGGSVERSTGGLPSSQEVNDVPHPFEVQGIGTTAR